jgi:3-hydroxybutyryl-CoA dehydrogenase
MSLAGQGTAEFRRAAVIGTGMMGPGIAVSLALGGLETTLVSRTRSTAQSGLERARALLETLRVNELAAEEAAERAGSILSCSADLEDAVATADLVIESGPEDMSWKQGLLVRVERSAPETCVLASNTSGLSITVMASRCARPSRVLTAHFWNPPHLMRLVELVRGEQTSEEVLQAMHRLMRRCGKAPVIIRKDRPGQLGNRLQHALWREAVNIVAEGIASAEDVDLAAKNGFGQRLPVYGIFEHADAVGLDLTLAVMDYIARDLYSQPKAPQMLFDLVREGQLGAKTGRGFYDWSQKSLSEVQAVRDQFLIEFFRAHPVSSVQEGED